MEQPIIIIKYLTDDPKIKAMIDMYWATDENGLHVYKNPDFIRKFGVNTRTLSHQIANYYEAYCIYDKCCLCNNISNFLKKRQKSYKKKYGFWQCYDCDVKNFFFEIEMDARLWLEPLEVAFQERKDLSLSDLNLRIFKALIREKRLIRLNEQFGMSEKVFLKHVYKLQKLDLLELDKRSKTVYILEKYKELFKNESPEKRSDLFFGEKT